MVGQQVGRRIERSSWCPLVRREQTEVFDFGKERANVRPVARREQTPGHEGPSAPKQSVRFFLVVLPRLPHAREDLGEESPSPYRRTTHEESLAGPRWPVVLKRQVIATQAFQQVVRYLAVKPDVNVA